MIPKNKKEALAKADKTLDHLIAHVGSCDIEDLIFKLSKGESKKFTFKLICPSCGREGFFEFKISSAKKKI